MDYITLYIVLTICVIGAGWTSYREGVRQGIESTLTALEYNQVIEITDNGDINPFRPKS
jgi:hypothetical protein